MNICHLTSAHPRYDIRIFIKMCRSLASAGHDVSLVVADGLSDENRDGVKIYGVKKEKNRLLRILKSPRRVYKKALLLGAEIYHLHDPELLPVGLKLKKKGKIVIFDSHEDYPSQILHKPYMNRSLLKIISKIYAMYEKRTLKRFDCVIVAAPFSSDKISQWHPSVTDIYNYPQLEEFNNVVRQPMPEDDIPSVCYAGGITEIRGIKEMVKAMEFCTNDVHLKVAGIFSPSSLRDEVVKIKGWEKTEELGFIDRKEIEKLLGTSRAGLVVLWPTVNDINSFPIKMFEYMAAELPVIASNFPIWKDIVESNKCGICVDPLKPKEIALAIDFIINNREQAFEMGKNGKKAVSEKYNWEIEKEKLLNMYSGLAQ
jgi:glycosyltransferase involved in cell wall biosynthesis